MNPKAVITVALMLSRLMSLRLIFGVLGKLGWGRTRMSAATIAFVFIFAFLILHTVDRVNATTFQLPLNALIEVTGDIPNPVSITLLATANTILPISPPPYGPPFSGLPAWSFTTDVYQSDQAGEPLSLLGFFGGCGGELGCGFDPVLPGYFFARSGNPVSTTISDSARYLLFVTSIATNIAFELQLIADIPDGLGVNNVPVLGASGFAASPTPLPATLPLFATGLGVIGLLGWRRKRKAVAIARSAQPIDCRRSRAA